TWSRASQKSWRKRTCTLKVCVDGLAHDAELLVIQGVDRLTGVNRRGGRRLRHFRSHVVPPAGVRLPSTFPARTFRTRKARATGTLQDHRGRVRFVPFLWRTLSL